MKSSLKFLSKLATDTIFFLIIVYQRIFSPDHSFFYYNFGQNRCRFFPSCSDYAKESFRQYGLLRGLMVLLKRVMRCHPWSAGGYDPVEIQK